MKRNGGSAGILGLPFADHRRAQNSPEERRGTRLTGEEPEKGGGDGGWRKLRHKATLLFHSMVLTHSSADSRMSLCSPKLAEK